MESSVWFPHFLVMVVSFKTRFFNFNNHSQHSLQLKIESNKGLWTFPDEEVNSRNSSLSQFAALKWSVISLNTRHVHHKYKGTLYLWCFLAYCLLQLWLPVSHLVCASEPPLWWSVCSVSAGETADRCSSVVFLAGHPANPTPGPARPPPSGRASTSPRMSGCPEGRRFPPYRF